MTSLSTLIFLFGEMWKSGSNVPSIHIDDHTVYISRSGFSTLLMPSSVRTELRGPALHYTRVVGGGDRARTGLRVDRGCGVGACRDGVVVGRVWASYLHLHALGSDRWADGFLAMAHEYAGERAGAEAAWA